MDNIDIKVSVIMPIYNAYDYIKPAIDSVLDQTLGEIELICIDDGSTDPSLEIIKQYQQNDNRVRIVTENNAGPSTARNKGIVRARGEYIIFLDADDFYEPSLLETLYNRATSDRLDIAVARFDLYNNKQAKFVPAIIEAQDSIFAHGAVVSKNEYPDHILQSTTGYAWNKLFKTSFIREKELVFAPELYVFEDVHFVATALSLAERVGKVDEVLIHHRVYSDQSRAKLFRKYYHQVPVVYLKIKEHLMNHGMYVPLVRSYLNLSASRCYKIYNLLWSDAKEDFWNILHNGYADSLNWYHSTPDDFDSEEVCEFALNVGLYTHDQYLKRLERGRKLEVASLVGQDIEKKVKKAKVSERFRLRLAKIFGRKKGNKEKTSTEENE